MLKDQLILKRRKACCISLFVLPPLFFFLATLSYILMDQNMVEGPMMEKNFFYSTNKYQTYIFDKINTLRFPDSYLPGSVNMPKNASEFENVAFSRFFECYVT